jgi:3-dehydroquinate synthase
LLSSARVVARTHQDKKARAGIVEYALPHEIGRMAGAESGWAIPLPDSLVLRALDSGTGIGC